MFLYISFPSSAKQQREMTKCKVFGRTWAHDGEFFIFLPHLNAVPITLVPGYFAHICTSWTNWNNREVVEVTFSSDVFVAVATWRSRHLAILQLWLSDPAFIDTDLTVFIRCKSILIPRAPTVLNLLREGLWDHPKISLFSLAVQNLLRCKVKNATLLRIGLDFRWDAWNRATWRIKSCKQVSRSVKEFRAGKNTFRLAQRIN